MLVYQRVNPHFSYGFPMVFPLKPPFSYGFWEEQSATSICQASSSTSQVAVVPTGRYPPSSTSPDPAVPALPHRLGGPGTASMAASMGSMGQTWLPPGRPGKPGKNHTVCYF